MITVETVKYIEIREVLNRFCQMLDWNSTQGGIWNADFTKPVFDPIYPTNMDGHVLSGESKYAFFLRNPEDDLGWHWKTLNKNADSLKPFLTDKKYNHTRLGEVPYVEISLITIILWLMLNDELAIEDAFYHDEW